MVDCKAALCMIVKNEEQYIRENLSYNFKLGFDHIFLYMNDWEYLIDLPNITQISWPGQVQQLNAYNDCLKRYSKEFDWIAFFDLDEFLVLKKHNTIQEFIMDFNTRNNIGINWQFYGANGMRYRNPIYPYSLLKQFTKRQKDVNLHTKVIVNCKNKNKFWSNPHCTGDLSMDTNGKVFGGPFNHNGPIDFCVINHYYLRSFDDWKQRLKRGRADTTQNRPEKEWFQTRYENCEVEDTTARDWFYV